MSSDKIVIETTKKFIYLEIDDLIKKSHHPNKVYIQKEFIRLIEGINDRNLLLKITDLVYNIDPFERDCCDALKEILTVFEEKVGVI